MESKEIGTEMIFGTILNQAEKLNNYRGLPGSQRNLEEFHI